MSPEYSPGVKTGPTPEVTRFTYMYTRLKKKSVHFVFGDFLLPIMLNVHEFGTKIKIRTCTL